MSVVANVEPLFQPCINATLVEIVSRNIADTTDPKRTPALCRIECRLQDKEGSQQRSQSAHHHISDETLEAASPCSAATGR